MRENLLAWLDAGAPGHKFDMHSGIIRNGCGTTCCIAGFVALQREPEIIRHIAHNDEADWIRVRIVALEALNLPNLQHRWHGHPLFDQDSAPTNCTPAQAAIAARFAFENPDHPNPWSVLSDQ